MRNYITPLTENDIAELHVGDRITLSGTIFAGRDAVLPKIVKMINEDKIKDSKICLSGGVIFHTAVSPAGVGPTSSNKPEIESSFLGLSKGGIKLHLGKGKISKKTIELLNQENAVYAVIPPVTALLEDRTIEKKIIAFPEEGMEAFYMLKVNKYPCIIAVAHGYSIYEEN